MKDTAIIIKLSFEEKAILDNHIIARNKASGNLRKLNISDYIRELVDADIEAFQNKGIVSLINCK